MTNANHTATHSALMRYRIAVFSRVIAAFGGGYVLSASFAAGLGLVLVNAAQTSRVEAVTWSTMLSLVVFAVAVL